MVTTFAFSDQNLFFFYVFNSLKHLFKVIEFKVVKIKRPIMGIVKVYKGNKQSKSFEGFPFNSLIGLTGYSWNDCEQVEVCFITWRELQQVSS